MFMRHRQSSRSWPGTRRRTWEVLGALLCLLAVFTGLGAHWAVLQSIAWGRMVADYSRGQSLAVALSQTFDGEHPCSMCLEIRNGRQAEQQEQQRRPVLRTEQVPEAAFLGEPVVVPKPPRAVSLEAALVLALHTQCAPAPPKPPPRPENTSSQEQFLPLDLVRGICQSVGHDQQAVIVHRLMRLLFTTSPDATFGTPPIVAKAIWCQDESESYNKQPQLMINACLFPTGTAGPRSGPK